MDTTVRNTLRLIEGRDIGSSGKGRCEVDALDEKAQ
jgi:hypothetical protein